MNSPWSDPLPIERYSEAPRDKGLYLIGTSNIDSLPVVPGDSSDMFLGANFPDNFFMFYVGQSIDGDSTVRARMSAHFHGRGNRYIGALVRASYPMFFVTRIGREVAEHEVGFLIGIDPPPIFSIRDERKRSSMRLHRETYADKAEDEKARLERQMSVDDEFDPY